MKIVLIVLLVILAVLFLMLTFQSGATSKKLVDSIADGILKITRPNLVKGTQEYYWAEDNTQYYMRKAAHVVSFLLGTLLIVSLAPNSYIPLYICIFLAVATEAAKIFSNGRHFQIGDAALNLLGVVIGGLVGRFLK